VLGAAFGDRFALACALYARVGCARISIVTGRVAVAAGGVEIVGTSIECVALVHRAGIAVIALLDVVAAVGLVVVEAGAAGASVRRTQDTIFTVRVLGTTAFDGLLRARALYADSGRAGARRGTFVITEAATWGQGLRARVVLAARDRARIVVFALQILGAAVPDGGGLTARKQTEVHCARVAIITLLVQRAAAVGSHVLTLTVVAGVAGAGVTVVAVGVILAAYVHRGPLAQTRHAAVFGAGVAVVTVQYSVTAPGLKWVDARAARVGSLADEAGVVEEVADVVPQTLRSPHLADIFRTTAAVRAVVRLSRTPVLIRHRRSIGPHEFVLTLEVIEADPGLGTAY